MAQLQDQFSIFYHPSERVKLVSTLVLAAQLQQFNPSSHALALRKIKRDAASQPYRYELSRMLAIGERQRRLQAQMRQLLASDLPDNQAMVNTLSHEFESLAQEYGTIQETVVKKYPDAPAPQIPSPVHPYAVMQSLGKNEAVIMWLAEEYELFAVVITTNDVQAVKLDISRDDIEQRVQQIRLTPPCASIVVASSEISNLNRGWSVSNQ
ncbi:hypothetical protein GCM10023116_18850 [Kistimonas scapharcae]|uniref:Uncharacterized protein n=1 Tax=Kistimonas scapharcae TaxID=1036133 RepID=A0ABP8V3I6_9GAMM